MRDERDTRFLSQYRDQELLIASGKVVWGQIVQANAKLFQTGDYDHPAAVVYSVDPHYDQHPQELALVAQHLFEQKGLQETARDLKEFSRIITDEYETVFNLRVPNAYTNERNVYYTSTMVPRKYLPDQKLSMSFFPYLVLPSSTEASMVLPSNYWPKFFVNQWKLKGNTGDRVSMGKLLKA